MDNQMMNNRPGRNRNDLPQLLLCAIAAVLAVAVSLFAVFSWFRSASEAAALSREIETVTERKAAVIKDNNEMEKELKHLSKQITDAEKDKEKTADIPKKARKVEDLNAEIEDLNSQIAEISAEIEALKAQLPPGALETDDEAD